MLQLQMSEAVSAKTISARLDAWPQTLEQNARVAYHFDVATGWQTCVVDDVPTGIALAERAIEGSP
jgi:hypothetical protein